MKTHNSNTSAIKGLARAPSSIITNTMIDDDIDIAKIAEIAEHEAAHAVMRWLRWLPATEIWINDEEGMCEGTGQTIALDTSVLVSLAGVAWEAGCYFTDSLDLDGTRDVQDLIDAEAILEKDVYLRTRVEDEKLIEISTRESLRNWIKRAGELLFPHASAVESIGANLVQHRRLSAKSVAAFLREYGKRQDKEKARQDGGPQDFEHE